jgi:hypothetical protein
MSTTLGITLSGPWNIRPNSVVSTSLMTMRACWGMSGCACEAYCRSIYRSSLTRAQPEAGAHTRRSLRARRPLVPVVVQRPLVAAQTRCVDPLMTAPGATSPRGERIPHGAAGIEIRLRCVEPETGPSARGARAPAASGTPDALKRFVFVLRSLVDDLLGNFAFFQQLQ